MTPRVKVALAAATLTIPLALAGTAAAGGHDKKSGHRDDAPGQQRDTAPKAPPHGDDDPGRGADGAGPPAAGEGSQAGAPGRSGEAPVRRGHADGGKQDGRKAEGPKARGNEPRGREKDKPAADKQARRNTGPGPQVKAGKTTICHATGSAGNPYVLITVSDSALKAHAAHQDGRDIIPAPAGGCPGAKPAPQKNSGKTTICHATGSATNPYVLITVSDSALKAHAAHQDGRDIIPAPAGGCPAGDGTQTGVGGSGGNASSDAPGATISRTPDPGAPLLSPTLTPLAATPDAPARGPVLRAFATGGTDDDTSRRESGSDLPTAGKLPFTGFDLLIVLALGLGTLSAGVGLHRWLARDPG